MMIDIKNKDNLKKRRKSSLKTFLALIDHE